MGRMYWAKADKGGVGFESRTLDGQRQLDVVQSRRARRRFKPL